MVCTAFGPGLVCADEGAHEGRMSPFCRGTRVHVCALVRPRLML